MVRRLAVALGIALAVPAAADDPRIARWEAVEADKVVDVDATWGLYLPWGDGSAIALRCPDGRMPDVVGLTRGVRVHTDLLSPGAERGTWQIVPSTTVRWSGFLIKDTECALQRRRTRPDAWAWALSEQSGRIDEDRPVLAGPAATRWAGVDALRQGALRPPGPHPVGFRRLWTAAPQVELAGRTWSRVAEDADVSIEGPARIRIDARALGEAPPETCILLDGSLLCQPSTPARAMIVDDGFLRYDVRQLEDGTPAHGTRSWQLAVGPGTHRLRLDRDMLVRGSTHRVETYGGARPRREDLLATEGFSVWTPPPEVPWSTVPAEGGEGRWFGREGRPGTEGKAAWHDVDHLAPDAVPVEVGEIALWIEPEPPGTPVEDEPTGPVQGPGFEAAPDEDPVEEGTEEEPEDDAEAGADAPTEEDAPPTPCVVRLGDTRWAALAPSGVHRFEWVGPSPTPAPDLSVRGCKAWLHATGPVAEGTARSLVYLRVLGEGELVYMKTDPDRPARLEVSLPAGVFGRTLRAVSADGTEVRFVLDAGEDAPGRLDEDGRAFTDPVRLPLPPAAGWWVSVEADEAAVRVQQPDPEALLEEAASEGDAEPVPVGAQVRYTVGELGQAEFAGTAPSDAAVRRASRDVAEAGRPGLRAERLVTRGGLLAARGDQALAARDLLRAEELDARQPGLDGPVGRTLRFERERALYGGDRWRAEEEVWVQVGPALTEADRARLAAARAGDFLAVATSLEGPEAVRWWRRALLGGQIPAAEERLQAFVLADGLDPHPGLQLLRTLTSWDGVYLVRGAGRRRRVLWPVEPTVDDALLYPDVWPEDRIVALRRGWLLRLPPRATEQSVPVRCLLSALGTDGPCRFVVEDEDGEQLLVHQASAWGSVSEVRLPPGPVAYIRLDEPRGAHAEILWEADGIAPGVERMAHEARPGQPLSAEILGPTALRVHVKALSEGPVTVKVRVGSTSVTQVVEGDGEVVAPVPDEGPLTARITLDRPAWVRLATRRPSRGGPVPTEDRSAILQAARLAAIPAEEVRAVPALPAPRHALAAGVPARTLIGELRVGSAEWVPAESRGPTGPPPAISLLGGLQSHVRETVWAEADGLLQARVDGTVIGALHGGGDARLTQGRTRLYAVGDLDLSVGPFADRVITAAHLDAGVRMVHPVWAGGTLQGRLRVRGHLRSGLDPDAPFPIGRGILWSRYVEEHPIRLAGSATLRHRAGPWLVARGGLRFSTNAPNDRQPFDLVATDASVDLTRPAWFTRLGAGLELRLPDAHRDKLFPSVVFEARTTLYSWLSVRTGLHPWAGARWRPVDRKGTVMLGLSGRFGAPRGLEDVRPSRLAARHVGEWSFWEQARARWPVGEEGEVDPDWAPPGPEPVEVAP